MSLLGDTAPDFSDPLGLLAACHGRMRDFCDLLERLPDWIDQHGLDAEAMSGVQRVLRYFDRAAPLHHEDEEQDLFPLLRDQPGGDVIAALLQQHEELEHGWQHLAPQLRRLVDDDRDAQLEAGITAFCDAYRRHIALEDAVILPMARSSLNALQLSEMGRRMAERRKAPPPGRY